MAFFSHVMARLPLQMRGIAAALLIAAETLVANAAAEPFPSMTVLTGPETSRLAERVVFTATVTSDGGVPKGGVRFETDTQELGFASLNADGMARLPVNVLEFGENRITATYYGDTVVDGSTSEPLTHIVTKGELFVTLSVSPDVGQPGRPVRLTADVSTANPLAFLPPPGPVTFRIGDQVLGRAKQLFSQAVLTTRKIPIGVSTITASVEGSDQYDAGSGDLKFTVDPRLGSEFRVNNRTVGQQRSPSLASLATGQFVIVWQSLGQDGSGFGIFGKRFAAGGQPLGSAFPINRTTAMNQQAPKIAALKGGGFVVVWESQGQDGSGYGIFARRFNRAGQPVGPEIAVNATTSRTQRRPSIALLGNGGFVVAWESVGQDGAGLGVYAQRFSAAGKPLGGEVQVNVSTQGNQQQPAVAGLANGGFAVTWASRHTPRFGMDVYARRFARTGQPQGGEILVNRTRAQHQTEPAIMALGSEIVVAWTSAAQDESGRGVFGQRLNHLGKRIGPEFALNTTTALDQFQPTLAPVGRGFMAAWTSVKQDGSGRGIFGQAFTRAAQHIDREFRLNATTRNHQHSPTLAPLQRGEFVAAWTSTGQDGSQDGVFAQRFDILQLNYTAAAGQEAESLFPDF